MIIDGIAKSDIPVLIKGEIGTGKELLAEAIHLNSERKHRPFVKVDCTAVQKGILQIKLFDFEEAPSRETHFLNLGKLEPLGGGTILLNNISEMDMPLQTKLLQVVQNDMFSHPGEDGDVIGYNRVIATTRDRLEKSMMERYFPEGLFSRINFININVPPLRDRKEQILPLTEYYFNFYKEKYGRGGASFSSKLMNDFKEYAWPGNIRELENMIKRIVLFGEEGTVLQGVSSMGLEDGRNPRTPDDLLSPPSDESKSLNLKEVGKRAAEVAEKEIIQSTLQETHWNRKQAAKLLRVSYKALLYKIQKYHLDDIKGYRKVEEETI